MKEAIILPKEHGRLIDTDELCSGLLKRWEIADKNKEELIQKLMRDIVTPIVVSTPTIIEADKKGEIYAD